eukprot:1990991-Rhodomonas_salina.2
MLALATLSRAPDSETAQLGSDQAQSQAHQAQAVITASDSESRSGPEGQHSASHRVTPAVTKG